MIKIKTGEFEVLESCSFLASGPGETEIVVSRESEFIKVLLLFQRSDDPGHTIVPSIVDSTTLRLVMTNWDNVLGTGFAEPFPVGTFEGRPIYISIQVNRAAQSGEVRLVNFTAYLGDEVRNG